MKSCLYQGHVYHARHAPKRHDFRYRVFSLFLDLDELDHFSQRSRVFGINRRALLSFYECDHGNGDGTGLKSWVISRLHTGGIETSGLSIHMLCYPRILGYVFNPLTVYYCFSETHELVATLHEVHNTFGEKHIYVLPDRSSSRLTAIKAMHVSPFTEMASHYQFDCRAPDEKVHLAIRLYTNEAMMLSTSFTGTRREMSNAALLSTFIRYPLMTLKVIFAIHFEAFRLWRKGIPLVARIAMPAKITTSFPTPQSHGGQQ